MTCSGIESQLKRVHFSSPTTLKQRKRNNKTKHTLKTTKAKKKKTKIKSTHNTKKKYIKQKLMVETKEKINKVKMSEINAKNKQKRLMRLFSH